MKDQKQALAVALMEVGAVLTRDSDHPLVVTRQGRSGHDERGFRLKLHETDPNASLSPVYFNLRTSDNPKPGPLTPEIIQLAAECMHRLVSQIDIDYGAVAGIPNAGVPFAQALSRMPFVVECLELGKEEGNGKRRIVAGKVNGNGHSSRRVLLVDDLITHVDTKIEALKALRGAGHTVKDVIVLIDREQGGRQELHAHDCGTTAVFKVTGLLDTYVKMGKISEKLGEEIKQYLSQN